MEEEVHTGKGNDQGRKGSTEALNKILTGDGQKGPQRPEPLQNLTNLQDILANNAARTSNLSSSQPKVATPQNVGFLGVKDLRVGGVVDANALQNSIQNLDLASQIQTQIQHLQNVQTNLQNSIQNLDLASQI